MVLSDEPTGISFSFEEDEKLPVMNPIVAHASEALPVASPLATAPAELSPPTPASTDQVALRLLTQHILRAETIDISDFPENLRPLCNAVVLLHQRASLAAEEATVVVADATATRQQLDLREEQVIAQAQRLTQLENKVAALQQRNERLALERRVLKKAYQTLIHHSTVSLERYVETAVLQHEQQLGRARLSSVDSDFEELEHLTSSSSQEATPNNDDAENKVPSWTPSAAAVPYTPVRIVPSCGRDRRTTSSRRRHQQQQRPLLSFADDESVSTPTTMTSEATPSPPTSDPHMFRSLAIPVD